MSNNSNGFVMPTKKVTVLYFTDILCVWAYIAQTRINELKNKFGDCVVIQEHFISVFGSVEQKIEQSWGAKGGKPAYCKHIQEISSKFDHVEIHPDIWIKNTPTTSGSCHLFLKAIQILEFQNELPVVNKLTNPKQSIFEFVAWQLRLAFFKDLADISNYKIQIEIAKKLELPIDKIQNVIDSGAAFAGLERDLHLKEKYRLVGSPTLVLNEGRQLIFGNVGYRVIEANIQELLNHPENHASWC